MPAKEVRMSLNLVTLLKESAKSHPQRPALVIGDKSLSYGLVLEHAQRFSTGLRTLGVHRGKSIALLLPNVPHFSIAYFGAHHAGCSVVPLNVLMNAEEIACYLEDSEASAIVTWEALLPQTLEAARRVPTCKDVIVAKADATDASAPDGAVSLNALIRGSEPERQEADTRPDDTAVVLYTSGTTGKAKGAELTHFNMFFNAVNAGAMLFPKVPGVATVSLATLPLFHSFGQTVVQNTTLFQGGTVILLARFEPKAALELMQKHRVTLFAGVPTMYFALLNCPEASDYDLSPLHYCLSGGAPMPAEVMKAFDAKYKVNILEGYGLSETSPVASFNTVDRPKKIGSIGRPIWGVDFKLVDDHDQEITESGKPGEICIRGHNVMKGYLKRPEATVDAMKGGWFHTGDVATRDDDGYYFIVDRKKDLILRGGFNVYPREIEEVLYGHPAVAEAAVIGVFHESHGEEVKAVLALKPGEAATASDIIAYCKERLAAFKYPRIVEFRHTLPKGPTGKIMKRELRGPSR
jgi:long-chain acyl-CoA synthetase